MKNRRRRWSVAQLFLSMLMVAWFTGGCESFTPLRDREPPAGMVETARATVTPFLTIRYYAFSPDGKYLIATGVAMERDHGGLPPDEMLNHEPNTVMILEWPSMQVAWRLETGSSEVFPYDFQWSPDSRQVWLGWFPEGRITGVSLPSGNTKTAPRTHAGFALAADGHRIVSWGLPDVPKSPGGGGYTFAEPNRLFIYSTHDLQLETEILLRLDGYIADGYGASDSDLFWLQTVADCRTEPYVASSFSSDCEGHSLYHLSLASKSIEPYWGDFGHSPEPVSTFNSATNLLLNRTGRGMSVAFVDLERKCPVFIAGEIWGDVRWYAGNKVAQLFRATTEERSSVIRILEVEVLSSGGELPCLPDNGEGS